MPKFRKKPIVIEAEQYSRQCHATTGYVPPGVTRGYYADDDGVSVERLPYVATLEGDMTISDGDWIIRGVKGEYYPCKPDIFEKTYEPLPLPKNKT